LTKTSFCTRTLRARTPRNSS